MSKRKKRRGKTKEEPQTTWQVIKDLFRHPFEYRRKDNFLGVFLGVCCLILAFCLLFYLTGNNI